MTTHEDPELVLRIFRDGIQALPVEQRRYAALGLFSDEEFKRLDDIHSLVSTYLDPEHTRVRPMSIGVFGAPGSGKSRLVRELVKVLPPDRGLAPRVDVNLTQVSNFDYLTTVVAGAVRQASGKVPFLFFDEFDTRSGGAPWGWLSWFLAPMQDGEFHSAGERIDVKRALFVFAGGTAPSFDDFVHNEPRSFAVAKGPDFVSRLRGYIDIPGVNSDSLRGYRRAAALHFELYQAAKPRRIIDEGLRDALLHVGRYKHGARSLGALVELMPATKTSPIVLADLQHHGLLSMHVDRGPLDPGLIGGCIALSTGGHYGIATPTWQPVCTALFADGAKLAYGGHVDRERLFPNELAEAARSIPVPLEPAGRQRLLLSSSTGLKNDELIEIFNAPDVKDGETVPELRTPLALFRMRYLLALRSVAQIAVSGGLQGPTRRFPGVAEELMLAIVLRHPVYVVGGLGGGAQWVGTLLGLGATWTGIPLGLDTELVTSKADELFRPPPFDRLPVNLNELMRFFRRHAIDGKRWVPNGLSVEENRRLFASKEPLEVAELVRKGLRQRFALPLTPSRCEAHAAQA